MRYNPQKKLYKDEARHWGQSSLKQFCVHSSGKTIQDRSDQLRLLTSQENDVDDGLMKDNTEGCAFRLPDCSQLARGRIVKLKAGTK